METMHADVQVERVNDNMYTAHGLGRSCLAFLSNSKESIMKPKLAHQTVTKTCFLITITLQYHENK